MWYVYIIYSDSHDIFYKGESGSGPKVVGKGKKSEVWGAEKIELGPIVQRPFENDTSRVDLRVF